MLTQLANPSVFLRWSGAALPAVAAFAAALLGIGLYMVWFVAPADYQQGETVKIMYIHVPAAWLALFFYMIMAVSALGTLVWRHPLADVSQKAAAPIGAAFTLICLVTGSLWGKPMWGTYWVWDARLTSVLVLFLIYCGVLALWRAIEEPEPGRARGGDPHARRRGQHADREVLGRLVEHPAPAGLGVPPRRADDPSVDARAAARDGAGVHGRSASRCISPACAPRSCAGACARSPFSRPSASTRRRRDHGPRPARRFHRHGLCRDGV